MNTTRRFVFAVTVIACFSLSAHAQRQTKLYIDNGLGTFTSLSTPGNGGSLILPPSGTLISTTTGISGDFTGFYPSPTIAASNGAGTDIVAALDAINTPTTINAGFITANIANVILSPLSGGTAAIAIFNETAPYDITSQLGAWNIDQMGNIFTNGQIKIGEGSRLDLFFQTKIVFDPLDDGAVTLSISAADPLNSVTYTLPDVGANADFVLTAGAQTIGGAKSFSSLITGSAGATIGGTLKITSVSDGTTAPAWGASTATLFESTDATATVGAAIPAATDGRMIYLTWVKSSTLTFTPSSGTILGVASWAPSANTQGATLVAVGTDWHVVGAF